jgi:hypothetical protein
MTQVLTVGADGVATTRAATDVETAAAAPPLEAMRIRAAAGIAAACGKTILAGFTSGALGAPHAYPSSASDQANLAASVLDSVMPGHPGDWMTPFMCADGSGAWARRAHTAAQIQQAGRDGKARVLACLDQLDALRATLAAAATPAAIAAIVWAAP